MSTRGIRDIYPLTAMQHAMLVESLARPGAPVYLQHYDLELSGVTDPDRLRAALAALTARHDVLRTAFVWDVGDQPLQVVLARAEVPLTTTDLRGEPDDVVERTTAAAVDRERATPLDPRTAPLLRVTAFRVADDRWRLVSTHHHLVLDGWSVPILHAELATLLADPDASLPPAVPFREFVTWQRASAEPDAEREYFAGLFGDVSDATPLGADLPVVTRHAAHPTTDDTRVTVLHPVKPDDHPNRTARANGFLPSTVVHAAWALLLARWSDVDTVVFGSTVSGRPPELTGAAERVGMFVNTAPLRIDVPRSATLGPWLAGVRDALNRARRFEQAPVPTAQRHSALPSGAALLSTVLAFQNYWRDEQDTAAADGITLAVRRRAEHIDLPLAVAVALPDDAVWVRLDHDGNRVERQEAERVAHRLAHLIAILPGLPPDTRLADIPLDDPVLPADEPDALGLGPADVVHVVAGSVDGALTGMVERAGATPRVAGPTDPATGATVVVAAPSLLPRLAVPNAKLVALTEPPMPNLVAELSAAGHRVYRYVAGTVVELTGPDDALCLGHAGTVVDSAGRPAPLDTPGESRPAGVRARVRDGGVVWQLGHGPADDLAHIEHVIATDPAVTAVAVTEDRHAWLVAETTDHAVLDARLPESLRPVEYHFLTALPTDSYGAVDRQALVVHRPPATVAPPRTPVADRLHRLAPEVRTNFLARLRAAAARTPGLRPTAHDEPPVSLQQEQWRALGARPLRPWSVRPVADPAGVADALVRRGVPADAVRVTEAAVELDPAEVDLASVRTDTPPNALTHSDYAAWQTGPERAQTRDEHLAYWRSALAGVGPVAFPLSRRTELAPTDHDPEVRQVDASGDLATWLAAAAVGVAVLGGVDDVVVGVQVRPSLPAELDGVPGPFTRLLPVRLVVDLASGPSFGSLVESARTAVADAAAHGDVAWSDLSALLPEPPPVGLAVHEVPGALAAHAGTLFGIDVSPGAVVTAIADPDRAHPVTAARIVDVMAAALTGDVDSPLRTSDLVADPSVLLRRGDGGPVVPPAFETLPAWVRAHVGSGRVAVEAAEGTLTYADLVDHADRLAARLAVDVGDRVAVCVPRGPAMVWAPLGVMTAGAAYVPLDPLYPDERLHTICADAGVAAVVTTPDLAPRFAGHRVVSVAELGEDRLTVPVTAADAAYVLYTSGSTGTPKGVVVEHRAIADFCQHIARAYHIDADTRLLGFAALTFDVSAFDLWAALTSGGTLVLAGDEERMSVEALQRFLRDRRVTAAELPPSLMPLLEPADLPELRLVSVGGEAPAGSLVDEWATERREFWNGYGPTETTVAVTLMRCRPPANGHVPPIGLPMTGHRAYVLDADLRLVPDGAPGELCVAGPGLARGYLGLPEATVAAFPADPYVPGERLYRTGDLVRWTADGMLEFLGRIDRQVKIRGFRVELGDVEATLSRDPAVRQVVAAAWRDPLGAAHLVAYVVPSDPANPPDLPAIRDAAAVTLPAYLLPTRLVVLDAIPLTRSGKIDHAALPEPVEQQVDAAETDSWTPTERTLARDVIGPLLGQTVVSRTDGFFQLGGNSLQATQVTSRVRDRFGVEISLLDFFADPSVAHLAELVTAAAPVATETPAVPMAGGTELPLSYPQRALYDAVSRSGDRSGYHAPMSLRFGGDVDLAAFRKAFEWLVARHAPLRVAFQDRADGPVQVVRDRVAVPFTVRDVASAADVPGLIRDDNAVPFDLTTGPLLRVTVYRMAPDDHVVSWNIHHVVTDGWSTGLQLREIGEAYRAFAAGREPDAAPLTADYGEFVAWHRSYVDGPAYRTDVDWWRDYLAEAAAPLGEVMERRPFRHGWRNLRLPDETATDVLALARRGDATLYTVLLAAYGIVLSAEYGRDDLLVVTPNALRVRSAWENLVGWFVNRVVVRLRVPAEGTFADVVEAARSASLAAFAHGNVPLELLRSELGLSGDALAVHLSVQNAPPGSGITFGGPSVATVPDADGRDFSPIMEVYSPVDTKFQVSAVVRERPDGTIAGGFEFDAARLPEDRATRLHAGLLAVLAAGAAEPGTPIADLRRLWSGGPGRCGWLGMGGPWMPGGRSW